MIFEILRDSGAVGRKNSIFQAELCKRCGLNPFQLKKAIQFERRNGALICSDQTGYFLPAGRSEIATFYMAQRAAAISRLETLKPFREALGLPEGQQEL